MPSFANCDVGIEILNPFEPPPPAEEDNLMMAEGLETAPEPLPPIATPLEEYGTHIIGSSVMTWIASESGKVSLLRQGSKR